MRIAYIVTTASPIGGAQIHVRDLAAAAAGARPCTGGDHQRQRHRSSMTSAGSDIPVIVLRHLAVPIQPLRDLRALAESPRRAGGSRARSWSRPTPPRPASSVGWRAGSLRVPVVFTVHGWAFTPGVPSFQAALYRQAERLVGPLATRIICVSEYDRQLGLAARIAPPDRMVTVHNGMPDSGPPVARGSRAALPVRLVMVARFGAQKDHPTLFRALAQLRDHPWELDLVGDGPLMGEMQSLAASLGLGDRVRFLGQRNDVDRLLSEAQISLLVTNWEGFPLSILEAMRAGLPVVASSVGGVESRWRRARRDFWSPAGRRGAAARPDRAAADVTRAARRLGASGRARFEQEFTLEHSVKRTLDVYQEVLGARG